MMSNGESKLIDVASGDAAADTEVRVHEEPHYALARNDVVPPTNSRSTFSSSITARTTLGSRPLQQWLLDDANSLRRAALQQFAQFNFVRHQFMTNPEHADCMLDDARNLAFDPVWIVLVESATGRGSSKDGKRTWDIARLVHEQINTKQYVLL
jgi:hypothetical protein